jgi:peptidoglycan/LPS O-acetylase OafA/YrhL
VPPAFAYLGRISYSIFLVHFPFGLLVSAAFFNGFPGAPLANAAGMALAFAVSILGGAWFYRWFESRPLASWARAEWSAGLLASGLLVTIASDFTA